MGPNTLIYHQNIPFVTQKGHTEVVRALLSAGAKVDLQSKAGVSPLHSAC